MRKIFHRLLIGLFFAIPMVGLALFFTNISADASVPAQTQTPDCATCHSDFQDNWAQGMHAKASSDEVFVSAWTEQGKPTACLSCHTTGYDEATGTWLKDGVTCEACHTKVGEGQHPFAANMSVDKSTDLCSRCHNDPRFGDQWKVSAHYQRDMSCTTCHDPHSAGCKPVPGQDKAAADPSGLCLNCHKNYTYSAVHSRHGQVGVTCVNCHLGVTDEKSTDPHQLPNHSFKPVIETCNSCHSQQMHAEGESAGGSAVVAVPVDQSAALVKNSDNVTDKPAPVSPLGFAVMAGLVGLAFGIVLAPWLEKVYQRWSKGGK